VLVLVVKVVFSMEVPRKKVGLRPSNAFYNGFAVSFKE
jgi:hypothetical protein